MKQRKPIELKGSNSHKLNNVLEQPLESIVTHNPKLNKKINFRTTQKTEVEIVNSLSNSFKEPNGTNDDTRAEFAVFLLILIGNEIELKLNDGKLYRGIFQSLDTRDNEIFICIQYCVRIFDIFSDERSIPIEKYKIFPLQSVSRFFTTNINGVQTSFEDISSEKAIKSKSQDQFKTDVEIGQTQETITERALQPWVSEENYTEVIEDVLGETPVTNWDQFEENRIKFGVEGTYDETLYTTPLNYDDISEEEKKKAELLAKEIESNQRKNHIYFVENDTDGLKTVDDEEMHFSSVYRETDDKNIVPKTSEVVEDRCNDIPIKVASQNEEDKNSNKKASSKTNFSFNPNAKEFQPRCITKPNIPNSDYNYGSNHNLVQVVENPLFMNYQTNHFYSYPMNERDIHFQQNMELNIPKGQYDIKTSLNTNPMFHSEITQYEVNTGEFVVREVDLNQHIQNKEYFVYDGSRFNEYHNLGFPKNYPISNRPYNGGSHNSVYYFQNRDQNPQSYQYYQVAEDPRNWSNEYPT
ncbi:hypothetical protein FG379_003524 [Cryptosporidium bovis]|uniref:uncharacterized protein n=1 Tax=Cryptosporidium bovis TaxID=310047 RepID=UPI00351A9FAD|nr:hypothetical protein FG379_003524 [Cryptosporidium bovis]